MTPAALDAVCRKAMAKVPEARYASAAELAREVELYLADEPVSVYREPLRVRAERWARRHRNVVTAAGVFLVCAITALVVGGTLVRRERDEARDCEVRNRSCINSSKRRHAGTYM